MLVTSRNTRQCRNTNCGSNEQQRSTHTLVEATIKLNNRGLRVHTTVKETVKERARFWTHLRTDHRSTASLNAVICASLKPISCFSSSIVTKRSMHAWVRELSWEYLPQGHMVQNSVRGASVPGFHAGWSKRWDERWHWIGGFRAGAACELGIRIRRWRISAILFPSVKLKIGAEFDDVVFCAESLL